MTNIGSARDIVKSDVANDRFSMVMIMGSSGSIVYEQEGGGIITITNALSGVWIPVGKAINIRLESTAIGLVVA